MLKSYNPKSHAPSVYIPAWLLQIPSSKLSLQAKVLYGRLAQWSTTRATVHRTTKQLSEEIGVDQRVIERFLKELRDVSLIDTYQIKSGGPNHYRFLDHPWIHENLLPVYNYGEGTDENVGGVPTKTSGGTDENVGPKVKEIKRNKNKSFCKTEEQKVNNSRKHDWAPSKNAMAKEAVHIEESSKNKYSRMPESLRTICRNLIETKTTEGISR
jgi:hypothetical protein